MQTEFDKFYLCDNYIGLSVPDCSYREVNHKIVCVCVCVRVSVRERNREKIFIKREKVTHAERQTDKKGQTDNEYNIPTLHVSGFLRG